jgi:hypothetical protein
MEGLGSDKMSEKFMLQYIILPIVGLVTAVFGIVARYTFVRKVDCSKSQKECVDNFRIKNKEIMGCYKDLRKEVKTVAENVVDTKITIARIEQMLVDHIKN